MSEPGSLVRALSGRQTARNYHSYVIAEVGLGIASGRFAVGTILPNDAEMMDSYGVSRTVLREALKTLEAKGLSTTVADMRFAKPLDEDLIARLMRTHEVVITVEEGSIGGLGAHVLTFASDEGLTDNGLKVRTLRLPDTFIDHDDPMKQYDEAGLNAPQIVDTVLKALKHNSTAIEEARA